MSYLRKIEYRIIPEESFKIVRNCSGCGGKSVFQNTNCFRVNANGNKIDVWLIYQCTKCKHTNNLTVYERCKSETLEKEEYKEYLSNSKKMAFRFGTDSHFFARNRAEVDWSDIKYEITRKVDNAEETELNFQKGDLLVIENTYSLKIRADKIVAQLLNLTRSELKNLEKKGTILILEEKQNHRILIEIN